MRLLRIIGLRIAIAVPTLLVVSLGAFAIVLLLPGEPARTLAGGDVATPEDIARVREQLGFNDPFFKQYWHWLTDALQFDFGNSLQTGDAVKESLLNRMPATFSIAMFALVAALLIGITAGVVAGARPGTFADKVSIGLATIGVSVPYFIIGIVLVRLLSLGNPWKLLPAVRYVDFGEDKIEWLKSITLPGLSLSLLGAGVISRQLRSGLIDATRADYVRTAWAVGGGRRLAIGKHALRNSSIPALAVLGSQLTFLLGATVVIEQLFAVNGVGTYAVTAATNTDLPAMRGVIMWFALVQIAVFLVIDIALVTLNPRVQVQ